MAQHSAALHCPTQQQSSAFVAEQPRAAPLVHPGQRTEPYSVFATKFPGSGPRQALEHFHGLARLLQVLRCYREAPTALARRSMFAVLYDHVVSGQVGAYCRWYRSCGCHCCYR